MNKIKKQEEEIIKVSHDAGFFSVCNGSLLHVLNYYNSNKKFCKLDTSDQDDRLFNNKYKTFAKEFPYRL